MGVEDVAGDQHGIDAAFGGQCRDARHDVEARLGQQGGIVGFKLAVLTADLPIGGMQEMSHAPILA